ncbi:hypothetical protein BDZ91DRAFT_731162 [Kalaharituber pfeilii]|nr:hypothetical protein BDZ91DRAFT_731162 [Kalaharituber pfeilii]
MGYGERLTSRMWQHLRSMAAFNAVQQHSRSTAAFTQHGRIHAAWQYSRTMAAYA